MDAEGLSRCGGEGCDGVVTAASNAWKKAQESQQEIISAMEEVEKLSKMVSPTGPEVTQKPFQKGGLFQRIR